MESAADYVNRVSIGLTSRTPREFHEAETDVWRAFDVGELYAGYVDVTSYQRWYRLGFSSDPDMPGTIVVLGDYVQYEDGLSYTNVPPPPEVHAGWQALATRVAEYITRPD